MAMDSAQREYEFCNNAHKRLKDVPTTIVGGLDYGAVHRILVELERAKQALADMQNACQVALFLMQDKRAAFVDIVEPPKWNWADKPDEEYGGAFDLERTRYDAKSILENAIAGTLPVAHINVLSNRYAQRKASPV